MGSVTGKVLVIASRMKTLAIFLLFGGVSVAQEAKMSRTDYLESKAHEAALLCESYIIATAKDPDSIKMPERYTHNLGGGLLHNEIYIYMDVMGRNTYGAVLRHSMICTVNCKQGKGCSVTKLEDQ